MSFSYLQGILQANNEGLIDCGATSYEDIHSPLPPLGSLAHFNTRGLDAAATTLAMMSFQKRSSCALVLGGGTGTACADLKKIAPSLRVESVSLTPFNPYVNLLLKGHDICSKVEELVGKDVLLHERKDTLFDKEHRQMQRQAETANLDEEYPFSLSNKAPINMGSHVPTTLLEALQNEGALKIFESVEAPVCDLQHVTHFPSEFKTSTQFDFIYDDRGPLYHASWENRGTLNDPTIHALRVLSPEGLLYATYHTPVYGRSAVVRDELRHHCADALFVQGVPGLLVVQEGHPAYSKLHRYITKKELKIEKGIVHTQPGQGVQDLLERVWKK